ncbi:ArsR/SmtB family transcription factor [Streptomyces sp. NBC_01803]|uniref:ArsR/SmtB family transcription factor n=1 Tax=Streptomyces sp. NBC_01803 TaxID=2975946 RepID=UPI002DD9913C|nr:metalloregulator ArsR/SmtB family transcription factor [Streptomyces sp. NBC_01803]WSA43361.1 metalloregulator ArsR/SmtB family transcription factor [Streptomyces sp. NBC_01803]
MHADIEDFHVPESEVVDRASELLRILSDPTRLRLLYALAQGETNVACLAEIVGANPAAVSQHLSKLRLSGAVKARRQGTFMYYTVADPAIHSVLRAVLGEDAPEPAAPAPAPAPARA